MPDLAPGYLDALPVRRPVGLRRERFDAGIALWRIDDTAPDAWTWDGFPAPRHRFDPASGAFRARYAGRSLVGAARERYRDSGLLIPADHASHRVVRLLAARPVRVFDLRRERNLDVLGVDDQINTGQHPAVWDTCHRLADAARTWWQDLDAIVYRSRTRPETSVNVAFFAADAFTVESWTLSARTDLLVELVLRHGFTVGWELT